MNNFKTNQNEIVNSCFPNTPFDLDNSSLPKPYIEKGKLFVGFCYQNASVIGLALAVMSIVGVI